MCLCVRVLSFTREPLLNKSNQTGKIQINSLFKLFPLNVLLNLCALTVVDDPCRAQRRVEMPTGPTVLAEDGASVA